MYFLGIKNIMKTKMKGLMLLTLFALVVHSCNGKATGRKKGTLFFIGNSIFHLSLEFGNFGK